jgi:hypothetical protein
MKDLLIAEQLFLLAHDDESGRANSVLAIDKGYAGALLLDLAAEGLLTADGKALRAVEGSTSHPLLSTARDHIAASDKLRKPEHWVNKLPSAMKPLAEQIGRSLVERGILDERQHKAIGLFPTTTWPEVDPAPERELRNQLDLVLVKGTEPTPRLALLIALLRALQLVDKLVDRSSRKEARTRAKDIAEHATDASGVPDAVSKAVQGVQAAVLAAVMVPVIASPN